MFPVGKAILGIILILLLIFTNLWWAFKPIGKAARKIMNNIKRDIQDDPKTGTNGGEKK